MLKGVVSAETRWINIKTAWLLIEVQCIIISMDLTWQALQTNGKLFHILESFFELVILIQYNTGVGFIQVRWGRHLCWTARVLVLNVWCSASKNVSQWALQTNGKYFSNFEFVFWIFGRKPNFFHKNSEAWILIEFQFVVYQWIRLNQLYKLMERFFSNFRLVLRNFVQKVYYISMDFTRQALQTNVKLFSNFGIIYLKLTHSLRQVLPKNLQFS